MKKQVFTLLTMIALVALVNGAFAQSTYDTPYSGATHTYNNTISSDGTWIYYVMSTEDTTYANAVDEGATSYDMTGGSGVGTSATVTIEWLAAGDVTPSINYYLVLRVNDANTRCANYRIQPIDIIPNPLDFDVWAIGTGTTTDPTDWDDVVANNSTDCPVFNDEDFKTDSYELGTTYVYFHVQRVDGNNNSNWVFTFTPNTTSGNITAIEYKPLGGSWGDLDGAETITSTTASPINDVLVRITLDITNAGETISAAIGDEGVNSTAYEVTNDIPDGNFDDVESPITISLIPTIGDFSE